VNSFSRNEKDCVFVFQGFTVKKTSKWGECWKTLDYALSVFWLNLFIAFSANVLVRTQPVHYQQMNSATCLILMQGYARMKIKWIVWKPHGVLGVAPKTLWWGDNLQRAWENRQGFKWCSSRCKWIVSTVITTIA